MMRQYELVERVKRYNPNADEALLNRAYVYAMKAHGSQKRASGDPYMSHPLEVAAILTELRLDDATIVAAVLHDTIEDTEATREEIDQLFGHEIGALVDGLTKIKKLDLVSKKAAQAENFRKLLLAIADDVRVLLVKLADRLHNMRTLHFVPPEKRTRIAEETLDIYAPLAGRMGMQEMREELEDLAFRHFSPDAHAMISTRLDELSKKSGPLIQEIERELMSKLCAHGLKASVKGRRKRAYSIWKKMERKSVSFEQLSDIFGFRIIVADVASCYAVLGIVHTTWPGVPGRFKDYISTPKQNDYRSLHTTVVGPGRQRVELQIRTEDMDRVAEFGIAAHALYKDGGDDTALARESRAYEWLRRTVETLAEGDSPEEFLEHTKLELFHDQVFCFTPKGRLIALPRGATPIDFAYAVHTDVGNTAVGCKVNGRIVPLLSELHNGDEVEIARAPGQVPPAAWESIVVTGKARAAIRRATRAAVRKQYAGLGRQIIERAFERGKKPFSEEKLKAALPRLARTSLEDVLAAVGRGEIFSGDVVKAVHPDYKEERVSGPEADRTEGGWFGLKKAEGLVFKVPGVESSAQRSIPIRGLNGDLPVRFAPNGGAVPGDRIVGILSPGEGITIYPIQSPALTAFDDQPDRWLDVRWDIDETDPQRFPAQIAITAINEPGTLAQIAQIIGDNDGNIDSISVSGKGASDFRDVVIDVEVWNLKHLNAIMNQLKSKPVVSEVRRVNG
ncbi:bifunctional (p)ppGpp synthetase/guanosine-3',5'-bis(diphosphate) 3'-pyrophosphohydrolase [Alsobacter soli]|uniref:GTP pyrophosphokinase rsh n=1 Tax=Alsobacter soli TaxID=2109933 RepID=A0A2T1HLZ6_9HYPH|nr:bifunctional (p)ppGpp synthetase/guanosine-3',5'-bis(diphosphate) 3'-pyrophosphohydrolase [Alsobacter soli]PSC02656.1 bifunctional (p)ppGpp synthetase/guanosine-3',5'-bis(diphosphate) 3'-pyrophosphohydrolase [Alsobacter soli]